MHIDMDSKTLNVEFVTHSIKEKWGEHYKLVTCDGLELEDSPTTQSMIITAMSYNVR